MTVGLGVLGRREVRRGGARGVLRWVRAHLGTTDHERRVARLALELFDLTQPLHGLGWRERRTLLLAALTHDVGRAVAEADHHRAGARMVRTAELGLSARERRRVSYLVRHHKGKLPAAADDLRLRRDADPVGLRVLLGILRAADGFDSRVWGRPRITMSLRGRRAARLCIAAESRLGEEAARRIYARPKKLALLGAMLGCGVEVRWERAGSS